MNVIDMNPTDRIRNRRAHVDHRQIHPFESCESSSLPSTASASLKTDCPGS